MKKSTNHQLNPQEKKKETKIYPLIKMEGENKIVH